MLLHFYEYSSFQSSNYHIRFQFIFCEIRLNKLRIYNQHPFSSLFFFLNNNFYLINFLFLKLLHCRIFITVFVDDVTLGAGHLASLRGSRKRYYEATTTKPLH